MSLPNCWELKSCRRELGGSKVTELGECVASQKGLGRSCWAIAGTLCGGVVQGSVAQKEKNCMSCGVYKDYNRAFGTKKDELLRLHPDEQSRYLAHMTARQKSGQKVA